MHDRLLPASPNWYCSRCSDINARGVLGFGAKNGIYLVQISVAKPVVIGELAGHKERVSGFAFCQQEGEEDVCASTSDDGAVKVWDIHQRAVVAQHSAHQSTITALHWSPVEKHLVVSGDDKGVVMCYWHNRNDIHSFFPEPRAIFCLACSPHHENYVAIGYKDGIVAVIDISKKGAVIHRLRGHDDEIHALAWCPQMGEEALFTIEHSCLIEPSNGVTEGAVAGCYLVSGSKDQTIRIWSTARSKGVMTLKLPFLKRRGAAVDPGIKERIWLTVHWPKGRPSHVVSSCFGGELVLWDLTKSGKQKWSLLGSADGQNHSRIVFNLSSLCLDGQELLISTSMDREIKCWDLSSLDSLWTLPTLGGFVYALSFSPVGTGTLALGVGDNMIRVWNTLSIQNKYDTKIFWQGIKSKVTALAWHPSKEGSLAFGTDDGKVGIYDTFSSKPPQISSSYHRRTVYTVAWGTPVPPLSFGAEKPLFSLYSCAGEGVILQHDPYKLTAEATDIDKVIRDTNNVKHKLSPHTDLRWKPDGTVVAVGNEDGSIEVFQAPSLKLLCTIQQHHKTINTLQWHHQHGSSPEVHGLLASGSSNALVYVHDLRSVLENPSENPIFITEPFRSLAGHTAKITGLAWSPHHDGRLVTVCYDGTAQVWDIMKEEPVRNYRGHKGRLLCVQWSPVDPDLVWTGGDDFTVQEWALSRQEHTKPPKGKRAQQLKAKTKKKKKATGKGGMRVEETDSLFGDDEKGSEASGGPEEAQSDNEEEEEKKSISSIVLPAVTGIVLLPSSLHATPANMMKNSSKIFHVEKIYSKIMKKRKPRSILPLSTSMDHRPREELQQDCVMLASVKHNSGTSEREHIQLGLFTDRQALYRMLQEEGKTELDGHIDAGHYDSVVYLRLWKGDIAGALKIATEKGELTDHLISVAPMAGYQVWAQAVEAYVKQLCLQEQYLKAASHLLSIHKVYQAIDLLKSHQLFREAIALSKARLQHEDPVLKDLFMTWAAVLEKDGHYATAAKCYLGADCSFDAAKVIAKKGDTDSLRIAASLAQISGERDLSHSLSLRCAKDLVALQDWVAAQEVLRTQESLLGHQLLFSVYELLTVNLSQSGLVSWTCTSTHAWSTSCDSNFLQVVTGVWERVFGVTARDRIKVEDLRAQLKTTENPKVTPNVPLKQLLSHVALDVTLATLSLLFGDWDSILENLLYALSRGSDAGNFTLMSEICLLLFPQGCKHILAQYKQLLESTEEKNSVVAQSIQAFICYHQMYQTWWSQNGKMASAVNGSNIINGLQTTQCQNGSSSQAPGADVNGLAEKEVMSDFLLSEPHATFQATQRTIAAIQQKLASLVQQHSHVQDTDPGTEEFSLTELLTVVYFSPSADVSESLPSLIALVSEHHKKLASVPESVKKYPFPDVMECCIVLLYMDQTGASVPARLRSEALGLLQKYGTGPALHRAWQRFVS
uniref:Anaphase-promoting complex subunit 4 WD40 domain-containing protein n=1 Tax=Denticeps clupeoides TaxID=299321 RepID=A0AAY4EDR0_9TELE